MPLLASIAIDHSVRSFLWLNLGAISVAASAFLAMYLYARSRSHATTDFLPAEAIQLAPGTCCKRCPNTHVHNHDQQTTARPC